MDGTEKKVEDLLRRFGRLKEDRQVFEPLWKDCMWYVAPVIEDWADDKPKDAYQIPKRITNKPSNFLNTCVTGIAGYAMSPNMKWFKLGLQDPLLEEESAVRPWLEGCERIMRRTFERCGFYQKSLKWLEQSAVYGQSAMLIEEMRNSDAPVRFHVPEVPEVFLDDNEIGETETVFRSYWTDIENVVNHYGIKAVHENMAKIYNDYSGKEGTAAPSDLSVKLLHAVYLRRTGKPDYNETAQNKKWASVIIDVANKHIISESGYDEFPYAIFFWEKWGKPYGLSPTMKAINDIALLQQTEMSRLNLAEISGNPPKIIPERLQGKENFGPGGLNYVRTSDAPPAVLNAGANYPITIEITNMMAQNIKEWYNVDFFLMLRQYQNVQNMTATAVAALQGEQTALLSALVSNLYDGLSRVIQRTFNILAKKRMFPPMPFALRVRGGAMKTDFLGVLAQAQKAAYEYTGITDVLQVAQAFAQFGKVDPEWGKAVNWLKPDTVFKKAIESRGAPADVLRTQEEYDALMAAMKKREDETAAAEGQALQNQAVLQNAQNLNERVKPDSMLAGLVGRQ